MFPPVKRASSGEYFYELHVASQSNHVSTQRFQELDSNSQQLLQIIEDRKLTFEWSGQGTFHLQPRGKLRDVLYAARYFICNDRMRELIEATTDQCQVFPIDLYRSQKVDAAQRIPGYYAIQLYEQLDCLDPNTVLPPRTPRRLPTFDPVRGYRIVKAKVGQRGIFRIAYENRRLVVSQAFRTKCDELGITGVEWLRRESI